MDMNDVLKMMLTGGAAEQVSKQAGVSVDDAVAIMQDVLPVLLKGMQGQATNKSTQDGFLKALADHSKDDTSDVEKFIRNVDTNDGAKIVNHLLGVQQQEEVAAKARAKRKSAIDTKTVLKIMAILAPLLMSKMGSTATQKKAASKSSSNDMIDIVGGLLDGVDAGDVLKIVGKLF